MGKANNDIINLLNDSSCIFSYEEIVYLSKCNLKIKDVKEINRYLEHLRTSGKNKSLDKNASDIDKIERNIIEKFTRILHDDPEKAKILEKHFGNTSLFKEAENLVPDIGESKEPVEVIDNDESAGDFTKETLDQVVNDPSVMLAGYMVMFDLIASNPKSENNNLLSNVLAEKQCDFIEKIIEDNKKNNINMSIDEIIENSTNNKNKILKNFDSETQKEIITFTINDIQDGLNKNLEEKKLKSEKLMNNVVRLKEMNDLHITLSSLGTDKITYFKREKSRFDNRVSKFEDKEEIWVEDVIDIKGLLNKIEEVSKELALDGNANTNAQQEKIQSEILNIECEMHKIVNGFDKSYELEGKNHKNIYEKKYELERKYNDVKENEDFDSLKGIEKEIKKENRKIRINEKIRNIFAHEEIIPLSQKEQDEASRKTNELIIKVYNDEQNCTVEEKAKFRYLINAKRNGYKTYNYETEKVENIGNNKATDEEIKDQLYQDAINSKGKYLLYTKEDEIKNILSSATKNLSMINKTYKDGEEENKDIVSIEKDLQENKNLQEYIKYYKQFTRTKDSYTFTEEVNCEYEGSKEILEEIYAKGINEEKTSKINDNNPSDFTRDDCGIGGLY